ncbi:MAG: preprotein translocase subunit SecG, partial [Myxococcota bacterium]
MDTFLSVVYVLVCVFLILVVLLQSGKGGGMGALGGGAGGGAGQQVFGGAGAGNILTKTTAICAFLFMALSATLAYRSSSGDQALEDAAARQNAG